MNPRRPVTPPSVYDDLSDEQLFCVTPQSITWRTTTADSETESRSSACPWSKEDLEERSNSNNIGSSQERPPPSIQRIGNRENPASYLALDKCGDKSSSKRKRARVLQQKGKPLRVHFGGVDFYYDCPTESSLLALNNEDLWYSLDEIRSKAIADIDGARAMSTPEAALYKKSVVRLLVHAKRWDPLTSLVRTGSSSPPLHAQDAALKIAQSNFRGLEAALVDLLCRRRQYVVRSIISTQATLKTKHQDKKVLAYLLCMRCQLMSRPGVFYAQILGYADEQHARTIQ